MIVALEPENLFYMTGFWGEAIGILEKNGKTTIIAPELEVGRAKEEGVDCEVIQSDRGMSSLLTLKKFVKGKVCTDCQNYSVMKSLKKSFPKIKSLSLIPEATWQIYGKIFSGLPLGFSPIKPEG